MDVIDTEAFVRWLGCGDERGVSSNTIASKLSGVECGGYDHPHDPADFVRCQNLLDKVPEFKPRLTEMIGDCPIWDALIDRWGEINNVIQSEIAGVKYWRSPNGYKLMRKIIDDARRNHECT